MANYLLEKHSRYGVDYELYQLKSAPTEGLTTQLELEWYREYQEITGDELEDITTDEDVYVCWYGVQEPIKIYAKMLPHEEDN